MYASVDRHDARHVDCLELLETHQGPLVVPELVVAEVVYLLGTRLGVAAGPVHRRPPSGNLIPEPVAPADWLRIAELVGVDRDLPLGTVDASVVAAAERLGITQVATLDRRRLSIVRPTGRSFDLLP